MLAFKVEYCYFAHPIFWRTYPFSAKIRSQFNQKFVCSEEEKTTVTYYFSSFSLINCYCGSKPAVGW